MSKLGRGAFHWTALPRVVACDPQGSKLSHRCKFIPVPYISHLPTHLLGTGLKEWNRDLTNSLRLEILFRGKRNEEKKKENKSPNPCTCKRFLIFPLLKKMSQIRGQSKPHEEKWSCVFFTSFWTAEGWKWGRVPYRQTRPGEANFDLAKSQISCSWIIRSWFKSIEISFLCVWGGLLISSLEQSLKLFCDSGIENVGSPCKGRLVED